jgi:preprotein translocase subunit SecA
MVNKYLQRVTEKINPLEDVIEQLSDEQLKAKTAEFRTKLQVSEDVVRGAASL